MRPSGIALAIFIGSVIGLYLAFLPNPMAWQGIFVFSLFNAMYGWFVCRVGSLALEYFSTNRGHR